MSPSILNKAGHIWKIGNRGFIKRLPSREYNIIIRQVIAIVQEKRKKRARIDLEKGKKAKTKTHGKRDQNLNSFSFRPSRSRSAFCFFFAISFAIISEKSSRLLAPGTPADPRECCSYRLRSSSSDKPSSSDASIEMSTPLAFRYADARVDVNRQGFSSNHSIMR